MAKKVIIAEDEPSLAKILNKKVISLGYETYMAPDGDEALKLFRRIQPDLLLLDIIMPKKNGFEVLQEIRSVDKSEVPVIIVSNLESNKDIDAGESLGAKYITKSNISLRNLAQIINSAIVA